MTTPAAAPGAAQYAASKHPTPQHLVAHFMATVADYEKLEEAFPLPRQIPVLGSQDPQERWIVMCHAMMMRKYFQPRDRMQLGPMIVAVHDCVVKDDYPQSQWDDFAANAEVFETKTIYNFGAESYTESQLLEKYLYGRYLHGDFGKWVFTENTPSSARDGAIWSATHARVQRVLEVAELVRAGVREGAVVYEGSEPS